MHRSLIALALTTSVLLGACGGDDDTDTNPTGDTDTETFLLGHREIEDDQLEVFSPQSPLGSAILGARVGETVTYEAPNGKELAVEIVEAEPYAG